MTGRDRVPFVRGLVATVRRWRLPGVELATDAEIADAIRDPRGPVSGLATLAEAPHRTVRCADP
jgi:hypothetical protein